MYVRLTKNYAGPLGATQAGGILPFSDPDGAALVTAGVGVELATSDGLPVPAVVHNPVVGANIYVGAEVASVRDIWVQLVDEHGNPINQAQSVRLAVFADADGAAYATTGGSTGIENDGAGPLIPEVAKKFFRAISDDEGEIHLTWTDEDAESAYLAVILPSGEIVISEALTNE